MENIEFKRICPNCYETLYYKTSKIMKAANKLNRICKKCANIGENNPNYGKKCPDHIKEIIRKSNIEKVVSDETREKHRKNVSGDKNPMFGKTGSLCPSFGRSVSDETKVILSKYRKGVPITDLHKANISKSQIGRKHSDETIRKMRISKINHIIEKNGGIRPSYNLRSIDYFTKLEMENNWSGIYANKNTNGLILHEYYIKDLGYFVDYYEPNLNIVVEYDEKAHYNIDNTLKNKDYKRMFEIKDYLCCRFLRYNENTELLLEY